MRALNDQERGEWCRRQGVQVLGRYPDRLSEPGTELEFSLPKDGLGIVGLSNVLATSLDDNGGHVESLVRLTDWGMWSEDYDRLGILVWEKLASSLGAGAALSKEAAAVLLEEREGTEQRAFLLLALLFQWDVTLVPAQGSHLVRLSHDGTAVVSAADARVADAIAGAVAHWKPRRIDPAPR